MSALVNVTYTISGEIGEGPTVLSNRPRPVEGPDGFSMVVDLGHARSKGLGDLEGARRIVAIAHPGRVTPEQVTIVTLTSLEG